jgi:hypothetical protein
MFAILLLACSLASPAHARAPQEPEVSTPDSARHAEYKRLHEELQRLVKRSAWAGAERTFQDMLATGVEPRFEDLKTAAQVAQVIGDVNIVRERLVLASRLSEDREVLDSLWAIDNNYGPVFLAGDPGRVELVPEVMPFDRTQARAVEHAAETIRRTGMFDGLLPRGLYDFGGHTIEVRPRVSQTRIDLRTDEGVRKSRRAEKRSKKNKD